MVEELKKPDLSEIQGVFPTIRGFRELKTEVRFCAFIDILGFGNRIIEEWDRALEHYGKVMEGSLLWPLAMNLFAQYAPDFFDHSEVMVLSDAIIISSDTMPAVLMSSLMAYSLALYNGVPLRGWISSGKHVHKRTAKFDFLVSEALVRSYRGEQNQAIYPRIVIDPIIVNEIDPVMYPFVIQGEDNFWFLNPLPEVTKKNLTILAVFIIDSLKQYSQQPDILKKYCWLADLYNSILCGKPSEYYSREKFRPWLKDLHKKIQSESSDPESVPIPIPVWLVSPEVKEQRFILPLGNDKDYEEFSLYRIDDPTFVQPKDFYIRTFKENWEYRRQLCLS